MILLGAIALAARLPALFTIPRFTDEVLEWQFAFEIARGARNPLLGLQPYLGPFGSDLLALALWLAPHPFTPRAFSALMGALTIPATYALGAALGGRRAGFIAGLLMATSSAHIVVNSHIAYVNSLTPLFAALSLTCVYVARGRDDGRFLIAGGFLFGLAAQTHPLTFALGPGIVLWFFSARSFWKWFRRPALYLALGAALLAYYPVWYALWTQPDFFRAQVVTRSYAFALPSSLGEYAGNAQGLLVELARMVGAVYPNLSAPRAYLLQPLVFLYALGLLVAAWAMRAQKNYFLGWVIGSAVLCIPLVNKQYGDFPYFTRYLALLLPPLYAAVAFGLVTLWTKLETRFVAARARWILRASAWGAIGLLALMPLSLTAEFYAGQQRGGRTNATFLEITARVAQTPTDLILLDKELGGAEFPSGGNLLLSFQVWFDLQKQTWRAVQVAPRQLQNCAAGQWLIATRANAVRTATRCRIRTIVEQEMPTRPGRPSIYFGLYQLQGPRAEQGVRQISNWTYRTDIRILLTGLGRGHIIGALSRE